MHVCWTPENSLINYYLLFQWNNSTDSTENKNRTISILWLDYQSSNFFSFFSEKKQNNKSRLHGRALVPYMLALDLGSFFFPFKQTIFQSNFRLTTKLSEEDRENFHVFPPSTHAQPPHHQYPPPQPPPPAPDQCISQSMTHLYQTKSILLITQLCPARLLFP